MRDLSKITSAKAVNDAITATQEAIQRGEDALIQGAPGASVELVDSLKNELDQLQRLKNERRW